MHTNHRDWTWVNEDNPRELTEAEQARADGLANWWSELHHAEEQEGFERQRVLEDGYDPDCPDDPPNESWYEDTPEGQAEYERDMAQWEAECKSRRAARLAARAERDAQMQFIEEQLAQMGLRMMRAYEHLAEDEDWYRLAESGDFPRMLYA